MATTTKERSASRESSRSRARRSDTGRRDASPTRSGGERRSERSAAEAKVTAPNATREERQFLDKNASKLSKSTLRAKWMHGDDRPDRNGQTLATRDPDVIRRWADARGAQPATVARRDGRRPRTLRFDFPQNGTSSRLEPIDWTEWLRTFEQRDLVFLFQEKRRNGSESNFFRLDSPKREEG
jgi:hypothetical protein